VDVRFDVGEDIDQQLAQAKRVLEHYRNTVKIFVGSFDVGLRIPVEKPQKKRLAKYLRILDASAASASDEEIMDVPGEFDPSFTRKSRLNATAILRERRHMMLLGGFYAWR